jgi:hypothetical protein
MLINPKDFNFSFFLGSRKRVDSLEVGAIENGGATKFDDSIYSNISGSKFIKVNSKNNQISIFIPSTINVDSNADNSEYIAYAIDYLNSVYNEANLKYYDTVGSWYSQDMKKVIVENITIITLTLDKLGAKDILNFINLANYIKTSMHQEAVSMAINNSLAII